MDNLKRAEKFLAEQFEEVDPAFAKVLAGLLSEVEHETWERSAARIAELEAALRNLIGVLPKTAMLIDRVGPTLEKVRAVLAEGVK